MLLSFTHSISYASNFLEQEDVEKFIFECRPNQEYDLELKFSPVMRLSGESRTAGQWSYEFLTEDKQYPDNKISLPARGRVRADSVAILTRLSRLFFRR